MTRIEFEAARVHASLEISKGWPARLHRDVLYRLSAKVEETIRAELEAAIEAFPSAGLMDSEIKELLSDAEVEAERLNWLRGAFTSGAEVQPILGSTLVPAELLGAASKRMDDVAEPPNRESLAPESAPHQDPPATFMASVITVGRWAFTLPAAQTFYWNGGRKMEASVPELHAEATFCSAGQEGGFWGALVLLDLLYSHGLTDVPVLALALTMAGYPDQNSDGETPFKYGYAMFDTLKVKTPTAHDLATGCVLEGIDAEIRISGVGFNNQHALVLMVQLMHTLIAHRVVSPETLGTVLLATGHQPLVVQASA
jgi:hypothetical protein